MVDTIYISDIEISFTKFSLNVVNQIFYYLNKSLFSIQHLQINNWSGKRGSNSRPQPWQGCALPTELFPLIGILRKKWEHYTKFFVSGNHFYRYFLIFQLSDSNTPKIKRRSALNLSSSFSLFVIVDCNI